MDKGTSAFERTPQSERPHIAVFGRRNVGKSSLVNALTGQQVSLVSDVAGTTTDPVAKSMELLPLGPCVLIDTAGWDDHGVLGDLRSERTRRVVAQTDIALLVTDGTHLDEDSVWAQELKRRGVPLLAVLNKADRLKDVTKVAAEVGQRLGCEVVAVSARDGAGVIELRQQVAGMLPDGKPTSLTGNLAKRGDTVVLVMPQDAQAPKGRLIMPQVQTLRDLLDKGCRALCCTTEDFESTLSSLRDLPQLVITDSQVFDKVYCALPDGGGTRLTSFSVLMAAAKGDIKYFVESAAAIDRLTTNSHVLIAEACTHAPLPEDIGREKIPRLLRERVGDSLAIDVVAGSDFPADLSGYDLVVHCGACMFNRQYMLSRVADARRQGVPMTNYGIAIAHLRGILPHVALPE